MLEYALKHGLTEETIIRQSIINGLPLPASIENAPSLLPGLELYYLGFLRLNSSRQIGFSVGPIPWDKIEDFCDRLEVDDDQREALHFHISALDEVFMKSKQSKN